MVGKAPKDRRFLTLNEVAERLNLSRMTVYRYVKSKKLPAYQFERDFRVDESDLEKFISQFKV